MTNKLKEIRVLTAKTDGSGREEWDVWNEFKKMDCMVDEQGKLIILDGGLTMVIYAVGVWLQVSFQYA